MVEVVKLIPREVREMQFPEARFLTSEEQTRYGEACKSFGEIARGTLNVPVKGSNSFKILLLNQIGIRTATLPELDLLVDNNPEFLRGTYEDASIVALRGAGDSVQGNDYVAKGLAKLTKKKRFPHTVILEGLKLKEDAKSPYGLSFAEGEKFRFFEAPDFDHVNNQRKFSRINPDYSITFDDKGTRTFYSRPEGVSRLCLNWYLGLDSYIDDLANSIDYGRVVVVSAEGTRENFESYVAQLQKDVDAQKAKIDKRFEKAKAVLAGK